MHFSISMPNAMYNALYFLALQHIMLLLIFHWIHLRSSTHFYSLLCFWHCTALYSSQLAELLCFAPSAQVPLYVSLTPQMFTPQTFGRRRVFKLGQHIWWKGTWQPCPFVYLQICLFLSFGPFTKSKTTFSAIFLCDVEITGSYCDLSQYIFAKGRPLPNDLTIRYTISLFS